MFIFTDLHLAPGGVYGYTDRNLPEDHDAVQLWGAVNRLKAVGEADVLWKDENFETFVL